MNKVLKALLEKRDEILLKLEALNQKAADEKRDFTDEEDAEWKSIIEERDALKAKIKREEQLEEERKIAAKAAGGETTTTSQEEKKIVRNYSFIEAIRQLNDKNPFSGLVAEMHQEAEEEFRNAQVSTQGGSGLLIPRMVLAPSEKRAGETVATGSTTVATDLIGFIDALVDQLVSTQLGVDFMDGLVGNVDIPTEENIATAAWEGEIDESSKTSPTFSKVTLSPKRLASFIDVSNQLLKQTSPSIEARLRGQLITAAQLALDGALINGSGTGSEPEGILNTSGVGEVIGGVNGLAPNWDHVVGLEGLVDVANALMGNLHYLTNAKVRSKLKTTLVDAGSGQFVWGNNSGELNSYSPVVSNLVPSTLDKGTSTGVCSAMIFGNFADAAIGSWGGLEILPNQFTKAKQGITELILNTYNDVKVLRPKSFSVMKDALTA